MNKKIEIALVDDHTLFRETLANFLNSHNSLHVAFHTHSPEELFLYLKSKKIDIVLCDIEMPEVDGFHLVKKLKQKHPDVAIIVITMHSENEYINMMINLEVNSYIIKDEASMNIIHAIEKVVNSDNDADRTYFTERMAKAMQLSMRKQRAFLSTHEDVKFTNKEKAIIHLIYKEKTSKEIAKELNISVSTVNGYREKIMQKMKVNTNIGLVKYAIKHHLVDPAL